MIQKMNFLDSTVNCVDHQGCVRNVADSSIINKINEIIATLNAIVIDTGDGKAIDGHKKPEPVDKFAEQKKWIGKLCVFWDNNYEEDHIYDILHHIDPNCVYKYCRRELGGGYQHCEPVKSDDDRIYKGE